MLSYSVHLISVVTYRSNRNKSLSFWKLRPTVGPGPFSVNPSRGSWVSRRERTRSNADRAGVGKEGGTGKPTRGLHSPVKTWHLSFCGTERGWWEGRLKMASAKGRARTHTSDHTHEHEHGWARARTHTHTETWVSCVDASGKVLMSGRLVQVWCCYKTGNKLSIQSKASPPKCQSYRGPCLASYLASMFLHLPSSFRKSATSWRRAEFSFSRNEARMAIWFSFSRRASRERLAAMLFFLRLAQYLSSCSLVTQGKRNKILDFSSAECQPGRWQASGLCRGTSSGGLTCVSFLGSLCTSERRVRGPWLPFWSRDQLVTTRSYSLCPEELCAPGGEIRGWRKASVSPHTLSHSPNFSPLLNILFYEPFSSMSTHMPFGITGHNIAGRQPGHSYQLFKCTYYGSSNSPSRISSYSNLHVCAHNVYCSVVCNRKNNGGGTNYGQGI